MRRSTPITSLRHSSTTLPDLSQAAVDALVSWATPSKKADGEVDEGASGLAATAYEASQRWNALNSELAFRRQEILLTIPALQGGRRLTCGHGR